MPTWLAVAGTSTPTSFCDSTNSTSNRGDTGDGGGTGFLADAEKQLTNKATAKSQRNRMTCTPQCEARSYALPRAAPTLLAALSTQRLPDVDSNHEFGAAMWNIP